MLRLGKKAGNVGPSSVQTMPDSSCASAKNIPDRASVHTTTVILEINLGFWELPTYPFPKLALTLASHLGQNDGLGEG